MGVLVLGVPRPQYETGLETYMKITFSAITLPKRGAIAVLVAKDRKLTRFHARQRLQFQNQFFLPLGYAE